VAKLDEKKWAMDVELKGKSGRVNLIRKYQRVARDPFLRKQLFLASGTFQPVNADMQVRITIVVTK